jgi:hypothetical protein
MPDFNPDREGHVKHKFIVQNGDIVARDGVQTSKGFLEFNKQERCIINDEALAREVQQQYPTVAVSRVRYPGAADKGHRYFFGSWPEMPWKRKEGDHEGNRQDE